MLSLFRCKPLGFSYVNDAVLMLVGRNLHKESSEVSIKTRSTPASLYSAKAKQRSTQLQNGSFEYLTGLYTCETFCLTSM